MRRALTRLIALWPLLLAVGWFASTTRLAGHLHAVHERTAHLDDARGDWGGDCELCRTLVATAQGPSPALHPVAAPARDPAPASLAFPAPFILAAGFPPLAARPPPAAS